MLQQKFHVETDSLILRGFTPDDYDALYALTRQPEITDILPDWDMNEEQLTRFLKFIISQYDKFDPANVRVLLAIEHKADRRLIGWCGVFPNDLLPETDREIAYAISKDYRNQGYTTQAVQAMVDYMFTHTELPEICAIVKPFNIASRKVVEKAGLAHLGQFRLSDGHDYDQYKITKKG